MKPNNSTNENMYSLSLILNDCATIAGLLQNSRNPILSMMALPYVALFCVEAENYLNIELLNGEYAKDITDIRNAIKIYGERFARSSKRFLSADFSQDSIFGNKLLFKCMRKLNIHYNLGVYCDEYGNVVGNTQLIEDTLALKWLNDEQRSIKSFEIGKEMGEAVGKLLTSFGHKRLPRIEIHNNRPVLYYVDANTNRKKSIFLKGYNKKVNLLILHMLSNLGFVNNLLSKLLPKDSLWLFRVRYVVTYYSLLGIEKMRNYLIKKYGKTDTVAIECERYIAKRNDLFNSDFRSCMMHYGLCNGEDYLIKDEYNDVSKNFYGLIESCYEGKTFEQLNYEIIMFGKELEKFLSKQLSIDKNQLEKL